jgi:exopolyphosphatase / guanosine-5'-triphosphate,3'-diphosphate pyrophosphatase
MNNVKRSSIDMGSNSVLLLIGKVLETGLEIIRDESRVTSLGKDLDENKRFIDESMDKTYKALSEYKDFIEAEGLSTSDTIITATEASRVATNAKEFFAKIEADLGFQIQLISSDGEAYYTGRGISLSALENNQNQEDKVIVDLGGASTELIKICLNPFEIKSSISLPFGSVRGQDWVDKNILSEKTLEILEAHDLKNYHHQAPIFVAGTMTSLACVMKALQKFEASEINGQVFTKDNFSNSLQSISKMGHQKLLSTFPYLGKRARTLVAGGLIIQALCERIGVQKLEISTLGLRHGTLFEGVIKDGFIT